MRLGLAVLLCVLSTGCAIVRDDQNEPVDNGPKREKAEPVQKPSEVLKPKVHDWASPITDHFYVRGTYFHAAVSTVFRLDPTATSPGTVLNGEDDLGLDSPVDQGRMEFNIRMREKNNVRIDYFKLDRFKEQPLPRDIIFGDFVFPAGTNFRSSLDYRQLGITYTYSFLKTDRFEAGFGLGLHILEAHAEGGEPGTLNHEKSDNVGIFPTIALNGAWRISKRWAFTMRGQQFSASPENFEGKLADYHADVQYRLRGNLAFGLGYSKLQTHVLVTDDKNPGLFDLDTAGPEFFVRASF
ncbi:MAG TPA: hypothetical protein VGQ27_05390 [Steroidobacteraceae bacterium]|jgi:hypothetical protein|nr:hypothetical protein [Steroidobacteraceae bacterium]